MKLAWLCWEYEPDDEPEIKFEEPDRGRYWRVVPIVYAEIQPEEPKP